MTRIEASAPGKLVLLGEYAVLEGAPALVLAVDRRARALLVPQAGCKWEVAAPTLGLSARLQVAAGTVRWCDEVPAPLAWVARAIEAVPDCASLPACRIDLDSDSFQLEGAARTKLGLGSSAAVTVALLGALHALAGRAAPDLETCVGLHRAMQHGRGSGIDIAASLHGGLGRFQLAAGRRPHWQPLEWPAALHWCCTFSGKPASTEALLAQVAAWHERAPNLYARCMDELVTISARGVDALVRHDAAAFLASFDAYATALARLGEASGAGIASAAHRRLRELAAGCGAVYKSCGAGGGDAGITFAVEDTRVQEFAGRAAAAGFPVIGMQADPRGLEVVATA